MNPSTATTHELRKQLLVLRICIAHDDASTVQFELHAEGSAPETWRIPAEHVNLPLRAEQVQRETKDAVSRAYEYAEGAVRFADPAALLWALSEGIDDRAASLDTDLVARMLAGVARAIGSLSDAFLSREQRGLEQLARGAELVQRSAEQLGFPVKPEDIARARGQYAKVVDAIGGGVAGVIDGMESKFNVVTEKRADWLRRWLPNVLLPERVTRGIRAALERARPAPLWLEIDAGAGFLPLVSWESLLGSATNQPILRIPYHVVDTFRGAGSGRVLIWCTAPSRNDGPSADGLFSVVEEIVQAAGPRGSRRIYVFVDARYHAEISAHLGADTEGVHLFDPDRLPSGVFPRTWFDWIQTSMNGNAIDTFHVVAPARISPIGEPLIETSQGPRAPDRLFGEPATYVRPIELADFACGLGAATVVLTGFQGESSRVAARLFCDQVARVRPGPVAFHDLLLDPPVQAGEPTELGCLYRFLVEGAELRRFESVLLYCHPLRTWRWPYSAPRSGTADEREDGPPWAAALDRDLEYALSCSTAAARSGHEADTAAHAGVTWAIEFVAELLERHSRAGIHSRARKAAQ